MKKGIITVCFIMFVLFAFYNPILSVEQKFTKVYLTSNKSICQAGEEFEISFHIKDEKTVAYLANIHFDETKVECISGAENIKVDTNYVKILWHDVKRRKRS